VNVEENPFGELATAAGGAVVRAPAAQALPELLALIRPGGS